MASGGMANLAVFQRKKDNEQSTIAGNQISFTEKLLCGRHYMNTSIKLTLQLYDGLLFQFIDVDTEGQSGTGHGTSKW